MWEITRDDLGPARVALMRDPRARLEAAVIVDNTACGPSMGGVRMTPDLAIQEIAWLARDQEASGHRR